MCVLYTALWGIWNGRQTVVMVSLHAGLSPPVHLPFPQPSHQQALTRVYVAAAAMHQALLLLPAPSAKRACFSITVAGAPFCGKEEQVTIYKWSQGRGFPRSLPLQSLPWLLTHEALGLGPLSHLHCTIHAAMLSVCLFLIQMSRANILPNLQRKFPGWSIAGC